MVPRKTKNEKICWALIGSKIFVFRFSEGPNHELHGNTKTKNENQSTVGQCSSAAVQIEQPSINQGDYFNWERNDPKKTSLVRIDVPYTPYGPPYTLHTTNNKQQLLLHRA